MAACQRAQNCIIRLLRFVGFYVSWKKIQPPSRVTTFLGITIDAIRMELRLPPHKLEKLRSLLSVYVEASYISKKGLETLTGLLAHCATVVKGGRVFCRLLYDLYKVMCIKQLRRIKIGPAAREDLRWWSQFGNIFNGRAAIRNPVYPSPMFSDSSLRGFGVYLGSDWVAGKWPGVKGALIDSPCGHIGDPPTFDQVDFSNINVLELWPILVGLKRWFPILSHSTLLLYTDNTQVKHMLCKGVSSNKTCMAWLRELYWLCVIYDIQLDPMYVSTNDNVVADSLSRLMYATSDHLDEALLTSQLCCIDKIRVVPDNCSV